MIQTSLEVQKLLYRSSAVRAKLNDRGKSGTRAWLRRQREVRCWARSEMARRLIKAAHAIGDRSITDTGNLCHNIYRWERGRVVPGERYNLYYCHAFGISPSEYGIDKTEIDVPVGDLAMAALDLLAAKLGLRRDFNRQTLIIWSEGGREEDHKRSALD